MSSVSREHAAEIDSKIGIIRRKVANFACGYTPETNSRVEPSKEYLSKANKELEEIESSCVEFIQTSAVLDGLIQEADEMATKIFARLSETFADFGLDMPTYADEDIPVGIPLEKLVLLEEEEEELDQTIIGTPSELTASDDSEASDVDFKPNIFITRPSDSGGPPSWTPMIKTKVCRTIAMSRLALE
ncbi:hypothetical protein CpipJ_CPIJ003878 [Culex quinquefasciatus]|uniref:Uncharacterized protein n=1 Tax=Culex quinquefasciatus TaxID=7176 RepID=B0WA12_CULQU|nr:uncharacterized protein LOC6035329 [Culex quinquefasciatus]XP_038122649.1 uncharacterized protein LOC6035329 [Culex quinquefasciatus]EDS40745.1 hypothetical protein CpipJ_CPIJ003878 [Culex quinquefasciatus]|eukprot:XP_001845546.1 hypothetical protein CpipJ_CPIJ003878 [Culex quinquefasciatus]